MLDEQAAEKLHEQFGGSVFTARQAVATLGQTAGSVFVRLSRMTRAGLIQRIEKGNYHIPDATSKRSITPATEWYRASEMSKFGGYATATYALSSAFMGHAPVTFMDFFLPVRAAVELENLYSGRLEEFRPLPRLHPFASPHARLRKSTDGINVVSSPTRAFQDLLLIIDKGRRPVSLEYEIVPFLEDLRAQWSEIISRSKIEGTHRLLMALVLYLRMISEKTDLEHFTKRVLPRFDGERYMSQYPEVADLAGREQYDKILETILKKTGILLKADRQAALSVMHNL